MRNRIRLYVVLAVCLFLPLQSAWGWNSIGHMAVAYVAYQHLTPAQQARAYALLQLNPNYKLWLSYLPAGTSAADQQMYVFMMAATWPDEIKAMNSGYKNDGDNPPRTPEATMNTGYDDKYMHKYWHFVDNAFSPDGTKLPATPSVNAETQIVALRADIASTEEDSLKSYDLVWLLHLVGDVHQPLHCTTRATAALPRGDAGGNSIAVSTPDLELHAYWDNLLGTGSTKNYAKAFAAAKALADADPTAAADLNTDDWVQESFKLAQSDVYMDPPIGTGKGPYTISPSSEYATNALAVAQKQVALAGTRLANVLNAELK